MLIIVIVIAFLGALAFQLYGLKQVHLGKTETVSRFAIQSARNIDALASIKSASSLADLSLQNLMGDPNKEPPKPAAVVAPPAPPPASLVLSGIMTSTVPGNSSAFIQVNAVTKRIYVGQSVDGVATLHEVNSDNVVLKRGERLETLRYPAAPQIAAAPMPVQMGLPQPAAPSQTSATVNPGAPVSPGPNRSDPRTRLWRLPPDKPGGAPRDTREKK